MPKTESKDVCSKCGLSPRMDPNGTNPWCKQCHADYQRDYRGTIDWRNERRGVIRGIRAEVEYLSAYFRREGRAIMGPEVASIIESLPGPQVAPEDQ